MAHMSLESRRDTWDYFRIDPDAVELSRAQAVALMEGGVKALEDQFAAIDGHGGECMHMLPEHRRASVRAICGDVDARASLLRQA